ncbi:unnamed protein product [Prorocentrum cordatum]|uniref:Uncharacterized protein n=1 Tax=Prorocentrum cordatum TaxID=2364126 RepID=A0ABN9WH79_9DINO|nr:unnamed protein product [Polarella glacialis]
MLDPRLASSFSLPSRRALEAAPGDATRKLFGTSTAGSMWTDGRAGSKEALAHRAESMGPVLNRPPQMTASIPICFRPTAQEHYFAQEPLDREVNAWALNRNREIGRDGAGKRPNTFPDQLRPPSTPAPSPLSRRSRPAVPGSGRAGRGQP